MTENINIKCYIDRIVQEYSEEVAAYFTGTTKGKIFDINCDFLKTWFKCAVVGGKKISQNLALKAMDVLPDDIRLHCGEITPDEMRTIMAVINWLKFEVRSKLEEN